MKSAKELLKQLSPEDKENLLFLIRKKSWAIASAIEPVSDYELERIEHARTAQGDRAAVLLAGQLANKRQWDSLSMYLFGGPVSVPWGVDPHRAIDPVTNPALVVQVPGWAKTADEHDPDNPFKPLPNKQYLRLIAYTWVHERILFVPKSRQLMLTWLFAAIASHEVLFRQVRRIAFINAKSDKADENIERVNTLYKNLPHGDFIIPQVSRIKRKLTVPHTTSVIKALGQESARELRGETWTWVFSDEMPVQEYAEEQYRSALAGIKGTGIKSGMLSSSRYTAVGTSNGQEPFFRILSDDGRIPTPKGR